MFDYGLEFMEIFIYENSLAAVKDFGESMNNLLVAFIFKKFKFIL